MAMAIAADIHPINNLRVLKHLAGLGIDQAARDDWYRHWIREGFDALEALAAPRAGRHLFGDAVTLADVCLVPADVQRAPLRGSARRLSDAGRRRCRSGQARRVRRRPSGQGRAGQGTS